MLFQVSVAFAYLSGHDLCEKSGFSNAEVSREIEIPLKYSSPDARKTKIYTFSFKRFDSTKNSVIYISGGPGGNSHGLKGLSDSLPNWNVIFFDPRGVVCSKGETEDEFNDVSNYTSEITVRDIDEIRKAYSLLQVSIYGTSYGTVPATMYASLHPKNVRSLVLEGTVYAGGRQLWNPDSKLARIQSIFDSLSAVDQSKVLQLSKAPGVIPTWFTDKLSEFMGEVRFQSLFQEWFQHHIQEKEVADAIDQLQFRSSILDGVLKSSVDGFGINPVVYRAITCNELGGTDHDVTFDYEFDGMLLKPSFQNPPYLKLCQNEKARYPYFADQYHVSVPVYYFQGETDGQTPLEGALMHFKTVPRSSAYISVLTNGGHHPAMDQLAQTGWLNSLSASNAFVPVFEMALSGSALSSSSFDLFNQVNREKFKVTTNLAR